MRILCFLLAFILISCSKRGEKVSLASISPSISTIEVNKIYEPDAGKIKELKTFIKDKNYNQKMAVFIDFKIPANKNRFFLVNLDNNKIIEKGLVSHGSGSQIPNSTKLQFSNKEGSYQSSLGKYEIKESYDGKFGKAYRLDGLDDSNSNARTRAIVLHYYKCVPDEENGEPACLSLGCPMLSKTFFNTVAKHLDSSSNTILLYIYY